MKYKQKQERYRRTNILSLSSYNSLCRDNPSIEYIRGSLPSLSQENTSGINIRSLISFFIKYDLLKLKLKQVVEKL